VVCGSPAYFAGRGTPKGPAELGAHDCITVEMLANAWRFSVDKSEVSVGIRPRLVVNTIEAAIDAAIAGLGLTRALSYQVVDGIRTGALAAALRDFEPAPWPVSLAYADGRLLPIKLRRFYTGNVLLDYQLSGAGYRLTGPPVGCVVLPSHSSSIPSLTISSSRYCLQSFWP
jgi:DNA-binding transcriptional LysR family regulator